jgi:hypothetical protein
MLETGRKYQGARYVQNLLVHELWMREELNIIPPVSSVWFAAQALRAEINSVETDGREWCM